MASIGRPTKYKPEFAKQAFKMALLGLTDEEMAGVLGVSKSTFNLWKREHPVFSDSITRGKVPADADVAASLYERACGYSHRETIVGWYEGEAKTKVVTKQYPPDTQAATRWLYNRQPTRWKGQPDETQTPDVPLPVKVVIEVKDASRPEPA